MNIILSKLQFWNNVNHKTFTTEWAGKTPKTSIFVVWIFHKIISPNADVSEWQFLIELWRNFFFSLTSMTFWNIDVMITSFFNPACWSQAKRWERNPKNAQTDLQLKLKNWNEWIIYWRTGTQILLDLVDFIFLLVCLQGTECFHDEPQHRETELRVQTKQNAEISFIRTFHLS